MRRRAAQAPVCSSRYPQNVGDELIRIVDRAMAEAVQKGGAWLVCRPGCAECCLGQFPISSRDAARLRQGLGELRLHDPERAARVSRRATVWVESDDQPCPALDPESGTCDLYASRPLTCRLFGPPVRCASGAVAVCELCFNGATDDEIAASTVDLDVEAIDPTSSDETSVAMALR